MTAVNDEGPNQDTVSRLTDDQARMIAMSGMAQEPMLSRRPLPWYVDQLSPAEASAQEKWRESPMRAKNRRQRRYLLITLAVVLVSTACGTFTLVVFFQASWHVWMPVLFTGLVISIGLYISWNVAKRMHLITYRQYISMQIAGSEAAAPAEKNQLPEKWLTDPDLQNLIVLNRTQIGVYQDIATGDAKRAARNSQIAMSIGFIILTIGAILAIRTPNTTSKIVIGALASIGSAMSGYIGQTFLKAQEQAMAQLNFYFMQPLVTSYILAAERLTLKLNDDNQQTMLMEVIENILIAANRAEDLESISPTNLRGPFGRKSTASQSKKADQAQKEAKTS